VIAVAPVIAAPAVVPATATEIERLLEWKPRLLDFDSTPLEDVIAAFNRRNARQLRLGDESLRTLPIVASIRSDNLDGFIRLLEATMNVRAEERPDGTVVLFLKESSGRGL
jgi:transmembrane sensor